MEEIADQMNVSHGSARGKPETEAAPGGAPDRHVFAIRAMYALTALGFLCLVFYQCITYRRYFHSDSAIKNLLAQEIIDSGQLFPSDWFYGNSDIWTLYNHLFIVPLLAVLPNGFRAHALSGVIFSMIFGASAWWLAKRASLAPQWRALLLIVLFSGLSPYMSETLYGQVSHGYAWGLVYVFLLIAWLPDKLQAATQAVRPSAASAAIWMLLTALLFVGGITGIRLAFSVVIPVLVIAGTAIGAGWIQGRPVKPWLLMGAWVTIAWAAGFAVHKTLLTHLHYVDLSQAQQLAQFKQVWENMRKFVEGWFLNSGISLEDDPTATYFSFYGNALVSVRGAEFIYRLVLNTAVFIAPWYIALRRWGAVASIWLRTLVAYYVVGFTLTFIFFIFGTGLAITAASIRYFAVFHVLSYVITLFWLAERSSRLPTNRVAAVALVAIAPLLAFSWKHEVGDAFERDQSGHLQRATGRFAPLLGLLYEKGLTDGYATFWNAAAPTVLSDHKVRIRALWMSDAGIVPMQMLSARRHYDLREHPSFLVLQTDASENEVRNFGAMVDQKLGSPEAVYRVPGFEVRTYRFNLLTRIPH